MRVLLHACCGPCLIEPLDALAAEHEVEVVFANPNIHPVAEYERRRETLLEYAREVGVRVSEEPYDPTEWMQAVAGLEREPAERCAACFRLRMGMAAQVAAREGFDAIATTLTVSPYQDADAISAAGREAAGEAGVAYVDTDFRPRYQRAVTRSRELGMYRQRYCGCLLSEIEAESARSQRKRRAAR